MGGRIKDQSWIIETKRFVGEPCGLRVVEPNGNYLILEKFENFRGQRKRSGIPDLYKINLNEGGRISTRLIEDSDEIFEESWVKEMDGLGTPRRQRYAENLWKDGLEPLYSPRLPYDNSMAERHNIPNMSIDNGTHLLAAGIEGEKGTIFEKIVKLFVRPISKRGNPKEINLECPHRFRRNHHADAPCALGTLHSEDTYAIIFEGKRVINVFREGEKLVLNLNFGKVRGPAQLKWSTEINLGLQSPSLWMGFTDDGSRLITASFLPYWNDWDDLYYSSERGTAFQESFRWKVKSWDIDGRVAEMARTKLRLEGKWKAESEREKRTKALSSAGLPGHVAELMALHEISDEDGIALFRHLRQGGVPATPSSEEDPLARIDKMAFTGVIGREDARFLIENRQHAELVNAIAETDLDVEYARWLLVGKGFADHPDAVRRVLGGASVDTVAKIEGIERGVPPAPAAESPAAGGGVSDTEDEESEDEWDDEWFSSEPIL